MKESKKVKINKVEYEMFKWEIPGRRRVMDQFFLDTAKAKAEIGDNAVYMSYSVCCLSAEEGTNLTAEQLDELPDDELIQLGTAVFLYNDKKKLKKSKSKSTVGLAVKEVGTQG